MPSLMAIIGANANPLGAELKRVEMMAEATGNKIAHSLTHRAVEVLSIAGIEETIRRTIEYGDRVSELARRLGISTDAVQEWDYALKRNGSSIEAAAGFFEKLASSRQKALRGNEDAIRSFQALGISIEDLKTKRLEGLGQAIAEAFENGDPQALIADLREVGGRGAGELVAAFRDGFSELINEARKAGVIINEEVIGKLRDAADSMKNVKDQFVAGIAPAVAWLADSIKKIWHDMNVLMRGAVGFVTGGAKGASELMHEYDDASKEADRMAKERRDKEKNRPAGAGLDTEDSESAKRKKQQEVEEVIRLTNQLEDLQDKNSLNRLSREEQITELYRRRAELAAWIAENGDKLTEANRLKAEIDLEKLNGEIDQKEREDNKPKRGTAYKPDVNQLQRIGAYASGPSIEFTALQVHQKSERHLQSIKDHLAKMSRENITTRPRF